MNKRLIGVLAFALLISGAASLVLYKIISVRLASASTASTTKVFVASRDLAVGALVGDLDVSEIEWQGKRPEHAVAKKEDVIGRGVVANIYGGEPFLESRLAAVGAGAGLAATIPTGMRAVAVRVNDVVGLAGFVTPGMRVDVLIMGHAPNMPASAGALSRTMLQNIEVLSAGQQIQKDAEGKPVQVQVVNMLVTPEQAEALSLANSDARIQLVLRNPLDKQEVKTDGAALARLFGAPAPPVKPEKSPARPVAPRPKLAAAAAKPEKVEPISSIVVEIVHGTKRTETKFKPVEPDDKPAAEKEPEEK